MDNLNNLMTVLNAASAVIIMVAAVYLARFEYRLLEKLRKQFYPLPLELEDYPFTRRQAAVLAEKIANIEHVDRDQWVEINRIRENH